MSLMSRKVDYALLILSHLDRKREGACAREIADHYSLSKGFVANILKVLCHKGYVMSHRGVNGGYVLRRSTDEVSLAELMDALDEGFHLAECTRPVPGDPCAVAGLCTVKSGIAEVHRRIRDLLRNVMLSEVFRASEPVTSSVLGLNLVSAEKVLAAQ